MGVLWIERGFFCSMKCQLFFLGRPSGDLQLATPLSDLPWSQPLLLAFGRVIDQKPEVMMNPYDYSQVERMKVARPNEYWPRILVERQKAAHSEWLAGQRRGRIWGGQPDSQPQRHSDNFWHHSSISDNFVAINPGIEPNELCSTMLRRFNSDMIRLGQQMATDILCPTSFASIPWFRGLPRVARLWYGNCPAPKAWKVTPFTPVGGLSLYGSKWWDKIMDLGLSPRGSANQSFPARIHDVRRDFWNP